MLKQEYLARNHGNRTAALLDLAAGFMRGNPDEFKQGYATGSALLAAAEVLGNREHGFQAGELQTAVAVLDELAKA